MIIDRNIGKSVELPATVPIPSKAIFKNHVICDTQYIINDIAAIFEFNIAFL